MRLTQSMRAALTEASKRGEGLRRTHKPGLGKPGWPANACTLAALVRHGLLTRSEIRHRKGWPVDVWRITEPGREALKPKVRGVRGDTPRFLSRPSRATGDYTTNPARAIDDLEVIDPGLVGQAWRWEAAERHAEADNRKARARQLGRNARAA